jgi:hypothetical protein
VDRQATGDPVGVAALLLVLVLVYGVIQIKHVHKKEESAQKLRFGIAQINMGIYEKREILKRPYACFNSRRGS